MESRFADVGGLTVNYGEGPASGPTLVFLHGFPGAWTEHNALFEMLEDDYHVVAPSMRGMGDTDHTGPYDVATWVEDLSRFMRRVVGAPAIGVGHSAGAWFGLAIAATTPDMFSAFVSLDQPLDPEVHLRYHEGRTPSVAAMVSAMRAASDVADLAARLATVPVATGGTWADVLSSDEIAEEAARLGLHDPEIFAAWVDGGLESFIVVPELQAWPGQYRNPLLFVDGDPAAGSMVSPEAAAYNLERYPWAHRKQLEGTDHSLGLWTEPDKIVSVVRPFLDFVRRDLEGAG